MRLNPDCIRDILLTVEELVDIRHYLEYRKNEENPFPRLSQYSHDEISYHINQCNLSGFIIDTHFYDIDKTIVIGDLSPKGHEFLANIRSNTVWNNTKSIANKVGSISLDVLIKVSTGILTQMINKQLGY